MLLAVEGGGFFSSSASGYSKGLTLLLLGHKNEEKTMRVSPLNNQYQLVNQETYPEPNLQLASKKSRLTRKCTFFICFGRAAAGIDTSSPLKLGPPQQKDESGDESDLGKALKSNLKKHTRFISESGEVFNKDVNRDETLCEMSCSVSDDTGRRSVQWTDTSGGELVEIREFEPSEVGSDDESDDGNKRRCSCRIM